MLVVCRVVCVSDSVGVGLWFFGVEVSKNVALGGTCRRSLYPPEQQSMVLQGGG